jgi:hypothetical protein
MNTIEKDQMMMSSMSLIHEVDQHLSWSFIHLRDNAALLEGSSLKRVKSGGAELECFPQMISGCWSP